MRDSIFKIVLVILLSIIIICSVANAILSFYNDGELVTASDLHCKSFAILEIGNINPWDDIVVTATIMPENVELTKVIK